MAIVCAPPSGFEFPKGTTTVTCTATDGVGNTNSCAFTVTVNDEEPPQIVCPPDMVVDATDEAGAVVSFSVTAADACSTLTVACVPPSGSTFPVGTTSVTCTATDAAGNTNGCGFNVTVNSPNEPPVCEPRFPCTWTETNTTYAIALDGAEACVVLDSAGSYDPDSDALQFTWIVDGTNVFSGPVVTSCLVTGCHAVVLVVSDGRAESRCERRVCVITASEAVEQCIALVEGSNVVRKNKRPLIASLKAAAGSFDRGSFESGVNQLQAFQNKVRAQIARDNPAEAAAFIECVQKIIDAIHCASQQGGDGAGG
jgi:hypothetical protein